MKQYKITSADFYATGDSLEPDAILSPEDIAYINSIQQENVLQNYIKQVIDHKGDENGK